MQRYAKAIAAAVAGAAATLVAVVTGGDPESIPGLSEAIAGAITAVLVYFIPNRS